MGVNSVVDRGSWRDTVIDKGAMIDTLVHVGKALLPRNSHPEAENRLKTVHILEHLGPDSLSYLTVNISEKGIDVRG